MSQTPLKQARNENAIEAAILNRVLDRDWSLNRRGPLRTQRAWHWSGAATRQSIAEGNSCGGSIQANLVAPSPCVQQVKNCRGRSHNQEGLGARRQGRFGLIAVGAWDDWRFRVFGSADDSGEFCVWGCVSTQSPKCAINNLRTKSSGGLLGWGSRGLTPNYLC